MYLYVCTARDFQSSSIRVLYFFFSHASVDGFGRHLGKEKSHQSYRRRPCISLQGSYTRETPVESNLRSAPPTSCVSRFGFPSVSLSLGNSFYLLGISVSLSIKVEADMSPFYAHVYLCSSRQVLSCVVLSVLLSV